MAIWTSTVGPDFTVGGTVADAVAVFGNGAQFVAASPGNLSASDAVFDVTTGGGHKDWSFAFWYKGTKQAADTRLINFTSTLGLLHGGTDGVHDGEIIALLPTTGGNDWYYSAPGVLTDDAKGHIAVTCQWQYIAEAWRRQFYVYVNGSLWITINYTPASEFIGGTSIGISQLTAGRQLEGIVDDFGFWLDHVLSPAEISALYNGGTGSSIETEFGPGKGNYAYVELYNQLEARSSDEIAAFLSSGISRLAANSYIPTAPIRR